MSVRILGYDYEADHHCVDCAEDRFPLEEQGRWIDEDAVDAEGNPVHPIFSTDEVGEDEVCGDCGAAIR